MNTVAPPPKQPSRAKTIALAGLIILFAMLLNAPSLRWGFAYDDYAHQFALRTQHHRYRLYYWSLYDFGRRPEPHDPAFKRGGFAWWTGPEFKIRFFRPISSLTMYLDHLVYGEWAPGFHLTSLGFFAILLVLALKLYRDLGLTPRGALWGLALLALEDCHVVPVGWVANRNTPVATVFNIATVLLFHHHRRTGRWPYLLGACVTFLLGLGSKESAIATIFILGLYVLLLERPSKGESLVAGIGRAMKTGSLWLMVAIGAAYMAFYIAADYGTSSVLYSTPWGDTEQYIKRISALMPLAFFSLLLGVSADIALLWPKTTWPLVGIAVPCLLVLGVILWRVLRNEPLAAFALGWAVFSILPMGGGFPSDRLFMTASVGTALLIAVLFDKLGSYRRMWRERRFAHMGLVTLFVLVGVVISIPMSLFRSLVFGTMIRKDRAAILSAEVDMDKPRPQTVFVLNSPSTSFAGLLGSTWSVEKDDYQLGMFLLQMGRRKIVWHRIDERTMTLEYGPPPLLYHDYEVLFIASREMPKPGDVYKTAEFTATILDVNDRGVEKVKFEFEKPLEHESYQWLATRGAELKQIEPPKPGETITLPEVKGLMPFAP